MNRRSMFSAALVAEKSAETESIEMIFKIEKIKGLKKDGCLLWPYKIGHYDDYHQH